MNTLSFSPEEIFYTFIAILTSDLVRYLLGAGGVYLFINLLMARPLRDRKIRSTKPISRQIAFEFVSSMRTVFIFACVGMTIWLGDKFGLLLLYREPSLYGWWWFVASVIILIILHDTWFYWMHWLFHRSRLLRRFHTHHHRSNNPSPFAAYSFSVGEAVLTALYFPLALAVIPVSGLAAFLFTAHMMLVNAIHHCGYEIYPRNRHGKPLFDWLTTTTHHDLHHANGRWNFGFYFTHWDRWMGTEHPQYHEHFSQASANTKSTKHSGYAQRKRTWMPWIFALILASALIASTLHTPSATAAEIDPSSEIRSIAGMWASEGYAFVLRFGPCVETRNQLCAKLEWAWKPYTIDEKAWHRPMLQGFNFRNNYWQDGKLVHPENGHVYRGKLRLHNNDLLVLQGCVAALFCDKQFWRRLSSLPHVNETGLSHR